MSVALQFNLENYLRNFFVHGCQKKIVGEQLLSREKERVNVRKKKKKK